MSDIRSTSKVHRIITRGVNTRVQTIVKNHVVYVTNASAQGADGPEGPVGPAGPGVPAGGTAGQMLEKIDATDYNTQWTNPGIPEAPIDSVIYGRQNAAWVDIGSIITDTDDVPEGAVNLYYTEARVTANATVTANAAHVALVTGNPHNVTAAEAGAAPTVHTHVVADITDWITSTLTVLAVEAENSFTANQVQALIGTGDDSAGLAISTFDEGVHRFGWKDEITGATAGQSGLHTEDRMYVGQGAGKFHLYVGRPDGVAGVLHLGNLTVSMAASPDGFQFSEEINVAGDITGNADVIASNNMVCNTLTERVPGGIAVTSVVKAEAGLNTDTINEDTTDVGVTVDELLIKDGHVDFKPTATPPARVEGRVWYDADLNALTLYPAGTEVTQTLGHEIFATVYNDNVSDIPNGAAVVTDPTGPFGAVHLALASDPVLAIGTAGLATELIEVATQGMVTVMGAVRDVDTSLWPINTVLYLSDTVPGGLTDTPPESPSYVITMGLVLIQHATAGVIYVRVSNAGNQQDLAKFYNGAVLNQIDTTISESGGTVSLELARADASLELSLILSQELEQITVPTSVNLTAGTDTVPVENWVFIPETTKVLTANITGFPSAEHVPVARVLCQSAASVATDGVYKHHRYQDHLADLTDQGHLNDINTWIRGQHATWLSGGAPNIDVQTVPTPDDIFFDMTGGTALQLHVNTFPSVDTETGDDIHVVNDPTTPYKSITNLNITNISQDSTGGSLSGRRYSVVIVACVNSDNTVTMLVNLPSGSYGNDADAIGDVASYDNYTLPAEFRGTGILIARAVLRHQVTGGGTHTLVQLDDLRGNLIGSSGGGTGASGIATEFSDAAFRVFNATDASKQMALDLSGLTTLTTRTLTVPDADGTIARTEDLLASLVEYRDGESVLDTIDETVPNGMLDAVSVSDDGGLAISWGTGKMRTPSVINTIAGSDTCTDNTINYLVWVSSTSLTLQTAYPADDEIEVACIHCQDGDIWAVHEEETINKITGDTHHGISQVMPSLVRDGLEVTEDTDGTNSHDVGVSAGTWYRHLHDEVAVASFLSRNVPLVRWFHVAGVWDSDTNAEIDPTMWDDGTNLVAVSGGRFYQSLFLMGDGVLHWVYPQEQFFTDTQAIGAMSPEVPPGLENFPKLTGYVYEGNESSMGSGSRWLDLRARIAEPVNVNAFGAISDLSTTFAADGIDTLRIIGGGGLVTTVATVTGTKQVTVDLPSTASISVANVTVATNLISPTLLSFTGVTIQSAIFIPFGGTPQMDVIDEKTADAGVTIEGVLIKDSGIPEAVVTAHEAAIDHDALTNYVAAEHNTDEAIEIVIGDGSTVIATGIYADIVAKCDMTITGWTLIALESGSVAVDVWKDTYANFPPTNADSIVTPSITTAAKNQATSLSISVTKGDILRFNVDSATTITQITLALTGVRA